MNEIDRVLYSIGTYKMNWVDLRQDRVTNTILGVVRSLTLERVLQYDLVTFLVGFTLLLYIVTVIRVAPNGHTRTYRQAWEDLV